MAMKVKEVIEALSKLDPELEVVNYVQTGEDCDPLASVNVFENNRKKLPYVGGDWPKMNGEKVVVLFGGYRPYEAEDHETDEGDDEDFDE